MSERTCSECGARLTVWLEDCIVCDGVGCRLCADKYGKMTVIQCENDDCIFGYSREDNE